MLEKPRVHQIEAARVGNQIIHNQNFAVVAQIAAREKRFEHAHRQRRHNPHARLAQLRLPFAAQKCAAAHRIRQNRAFHAALCRIAHRAQQRLNFPLRLNNIKRQRTRLLGSLNIRQHGINNFIRLREQAHGVVFARRQPRNAGGNMADALITLLHLAVQLGIAIAQMLLGKRAVKRIHLLAALGARRAQPWLANHKIRNHAKHGKHKQNDEPRKRRARIALLIQHANHAGDYRQNVQPKKDLRPRNIKIHVYPVQSIKYRQPEILTAFRLHKKAA